MNGDRNTKKGFTLIELLISVFIFSIIIGGVVNSLFAGIRLQQRISADQKMLAEVSFLLEYMGRTLRMARRDINGVCTGLLNSNYASPQGDGQIVFMNSDGDCQEFRMSYGLMFEIVSIPGKPSVYQPMTSYFNTEVRKIVFNNAGSVWHSSGPERNQSRVAIGLEVSPIVRGEADHSRMFFFQTVISQRKLNIPIQ